MKNLFIVYILFFCIQFESYSQTSFNLIDGDVWELKSKRLNTNGITYSDEIYIKFLPNNKLVWGFSADEFLKPEPFESWIVKDDYININFSANSFKYFGKIMSNSYMKGTWESKVDQVQPVNWTANRISSISDENQNPIGKPVSSSSEWQGNGSGIIISTDGFLVTNNHVVSEMNEIEVEFKYNQKISSFKAKVIKTDPANDLAILKIEDDGFTNLKSIPFSFLTNSAEVGTEVFALGYPMALSIMGKDIKFTDGRISSKTGYKGDVTTYQTTTPIQPGNSGGPLFDHKANLIGINSSGLRKDIAENVSYTIKTNYLMNLIDVLPKSIPIPSSTWISTKPLTEQIKILSNYVVLVKVR